jgi:hypothetical protein
VSESELVADASEVFGVDRTGDGEDQSMWSLASASRVSREEDRWVCGSEPVFEEVAESQA